MKFFPPMSRNSSLKIAATITYDAFAEFPADLWKWPNFTPVEMACRGDGALKIDVESMDKLQALREMLDKPLYINSAYRSPGYNKQIGGALHSQHMLAKAFDVSMSNHDPILFEAAARKVGFTGFGYYPESGFMHIDTGRARSWGDHWPVTPPKIAPEPAKRPSSEETHEKDVTGETGGAGEAAGGFVDDIATVVTGALRRFGRGLR